MSPGHTRRHFLRAVGPASLAAPLCAATAQTRPSPSGRPPNIILVLTDDQGYGDLGCHGNPIIRTPHLDALHGQSVRLTNFHVAPTCAPTRAGLMTGRDCNRTGVWHTVMGRSILREDEVTVAQVLSEGGYRTGIFGKWHLGDNYPSRPQDKGFGEVLIHGGGGVGQAPDYWGNDYFDDTYFRNGVPTPCQGYCTDVFFREAMSFIEANRDHPFFAYIPTNAPHGPYTVDRKYSQPYLDAGVKESTARFYGMITNIDENMGRLMGHVSQLGLADNTILIFMTDNGTSEPGFNAGMRGRKGSEYEGGHRVPCFIRWPKGNLAPAGTDIDRLAANVDLLPTLAELCGLHPTAGLKLDGKSLVPLLRGQAPDWPERVIITDSQRIEYPEKWRQSAVMTERWRLVNGKELYDIRADPGQEHDLAAEHADVVAKLREEYDRWWEELLPTFDDYCEIVVGADAENPSRLGSHDWHDVFPPWNQTHILEGQVANGFWAVRVAQAGEYEITLRRWPEEANTPITGAVPGGTAIAAHAARLKVADVDTQQPIPEGASGVTLTVQLPAGDTRLQTWLINDAGEDRGAYYVYVKRN
ncbi:MAG: arylsulfatase [Armatimonadetes bacterium]|nr:arylsulfatase [Armatimonadota bacterium]